jgi:hypothetical protein
LNRSCPLSCVPPSPTRLSISLLCQPALKYAKNSPCTAREEMESYSLENHSTESSALNSHIRIVRRTSHCAITTLAVLLDLFPFKTRNLHADPQSMGRLVAPVINICPSGPRSATGCRKISEGSSCLCESSVDFRLGSDRATRLLGHRS